MTGTACGGQIAWSIALTADLPAEFPHRAVTICDRCWTAARHEWPSDALRAMAVPCPATPPLTLLGLPVVPWLDSRRAGGLTFRASYGERYPITVTPRDQTEDR